MARPSFDTLSDVVLSIASELSVDAVLDKLLHAARDLVGARYAALGVPDAEGTGFAQFLHLGMSDELVAELGPLPRTHGLLGAMLSDTEPYRTDDITEDRRFQWWPAAHPKMRSFLGVPIVSKGDVVGAFYLTDKEGADRFSDADQLGIEVLAAHAAIAIEHAQLYERSRELSIAEERNRLARDLHDAMSQNLFSLSLIARTAASLVRSDPDRAVTEIDRVQQLAKDTQAELRALIDELRPAQLSEHGLPETLRQQAELLGRAHGIPVEVAVSGDRCLDDASEQQAFRIAQEALHNALRHGQPARVGVQLDCRDGRFLLEIRDDGVGFDPQQRAIASRRLGLTSMRDRARAIGGRLTIHSRPGAGTHVRLEVSGG